MPFRFVAPVCDFARRSLSPSVFPHPAPLSADYCSTILLPLFDGRQQRDVQASSQSDGDGWMEAWISCALHVRQQEVKEKVQRSVRHSLHISTYG